MKCVKCPGRLVELRAGAVGVDRCDTCLGLWFDAKELAGVINHVRAADFEPVSSRGPLSSEAPHDEAHQRDTGVCPRCGIELARTETLTFEGMFYDRCGQCGGAWLEAGELKRIATDDDASAEMAFFTKRR